MACLLGTKFWVRENPCPVDVLGILTRIVASPGVVAFRSLSHVQLIATPWTAARQASLSFTISRCSLVQFARSELQKARRIPLLAIGRGQWNLGRCLGLGLGLT